MRPAKSVSPEPAAGSRTIHPARCADYASRRLTRTAARRRPSAQENRAQAERIRAARGPGAVARGLLGDGGARAAEAADPRRGDGDEHPGPHGEPARPGLPGRPQAHDAGVRPRAADGRGRCWPTRGRAAGRVQREKVDLARVVSDCLELLEPDIDAKGARVVVDPMPIVPRQPRAAQRRRRQPRSPTRSSTARAPTRRSASAISREGIGWTFTVDSHGRPDPGARADDHLRPVAARAERAPREGRRPRPRDRPPDRRAPRRRGRRAAPQRRAATASTSRSRPRRRRELAAASSPAHLRA